MGFFKKIANKVNETQKKIIKKVQDKIVKKAEDVIEPSTKAAEQVYDYQKEVIDDLKAKIESELKEKYNHAVSNIFDKLLKYLSGGNAFMKLCGAILKHYRQRILGELKK